MRKREQVVAHLGECAPTIECEPKQKGARMQVSQARSGPDKERPKRVGAGAGAGAGPHALTPSRSHTPTPSQLHALTHSRASAGAGENERKHMCERERVVAHLGECAPTKELEQVQEHEQVHEQEQKQVHEQVQEQEQAQEQGRGHSGTDRHGRQPGPKCGPKSMAPSGVKSSPHSGVAQESQLDMRALQQPAGINWNLSKQQSRGDVYLNEVSANTSIHSP